MKGRFNSKHFYLISISLIIGLGIIVYSNSFFCSFHFDDENSIVDNFFIRNIQNFYNVWIFLPRRFIPYLSIALNYHFNGLHVVGYHIFNLAVHLISAILVWWLTLLTLSTPVMKGEKIALHSNTIALLAGLIFVVHPVQTEAVTYIVQRTASMATMFYLASLCFYVQSKLLQNTKSTQKMYYIGSFLAAVVAMFTKEIAITLPLMILFYEFSFFKKKGSFNWKYLAPFLLTILIIPVTMLLTETGAARLQQLRSEPGISSMHYFLTQFRVIVTYIRLLFLPLHQNIDYDYPTYRSIFEWPVLTSFLFLMTVLYFTKCLFSKYRLLAFSIFWFFLTLLPESSILPIKDVISEHRLYLPMAGFSLFLASGLYYLFGKSNIKKMIVPVLIIISCYSLLTYQRNKVWKDDFTLWNDAVSKSPHKSRVYCNRGIFYAKHNDFIQAVSDYDRAIAIDPNDAKAYFNRGLSYAKQGHFTEAISDYNRAIEIKPDYSNAYCNRGSSYGEENNFIQAMSDLDKSIELDPNFAEAYNNRGIIYAHQGEIVQAMSDFARAIEKDPNYEKAYFNLGLAYAKQGHLTQAISDYNRAIKLNPDYILAYYNRGLSYAKQKNFTRAIFDYNKAIELNPQNAGAYINRAIICYQLGNYDKAWGDLHKAEELGAVVNPDLINALKQASGR